MKPTTIPPSLPNETTAPLLEADQAGSESRQKEHQDAQGKHPPRRLTLDALQEFAKWTKRVNARNSQPEKLHD